MSETKTLIREIELCVKIGLPRAVVTKMRRDNLLQGVDWYYSARPKAVCYTEAGLAKLEQFIGSSIELPAPSSNKWLPNDKVPRIAANGLILTRGRPGWWTEDEALVTANRFANRRAIRVRWNETDVICRVKNAEFFALGQVIPVRHYDHILVAARQPRSYGRW